MEAAIWEFGLGVLLAYLVISPRLRRFIAGIIKSLFYKNNKEPMDKIYINPKTFKSQLDSKPVEPGRTGLNVSDKEVEKWLSNNPDLRAANGRH